jgi:hypothetical protein
MTDASAAQKKISVSPKARRAVTLYIEDLR